MAPDAPSRTGRRGGPDFATGSPTHLLRSRSAETVTVRQLRNSIRMPTKVQTLALTATSVVMAASAVIAVTAGTGNAAPAPIPADKTIAGGRYAENPDNPLAVGSWGINTDNRDGVYRAYQSSSGRATTLLGRIASQPRLMNFNANNSAQAAKGIEGQTGGQSDVLAQLYYFGIFSAGGGEGSRQALTAAQRTAYWNGVVSLSSALGRSKVALVMEPDLALLSASKTGSSAFKDAATRRSLVSRAVGYIAAHNPNTTVYLEIGDGDWLTPADAATLLMQTGVQQIRGFALGYSHYVAVQDDLPYGKAIVDALNARGASNKHFVLDTADNGRPYTFAQYKAKYGANSIPNAGAYSTDPSAKMVDALGIKPTWRTGDANLTGLPANLNDLAKTYVDAYLWISKPWWTGQRAPFNLRNALAAAQASTYADDGTYLRPASQYYTPGAPDLRIGAKPHSGPTSKAKTRVVIRKVRKVKHGATARYVVRGSIKGMVAPRRGVLVLKRSGVRIGRSTVKATGAFQIRSKGVKNKRHARLVVTYKGNAKNAASAAARRA